MNGAKVLAWGRAVPDQVVTNHDLEKLFETSDEWIVQRTGIKERRIAKPEDTAVSLGAKAAQNALTKSGLKAEDIDLIICATATGDYLFPATSCLIQDKLGAINAASFDISAACTGFIYGLNTAYTYIASGQFKNVLVIAVDLMSRFTDWGDRRTAIIFGDGAGAAVLQACAPEENAFKSFYIKSRGDGDCTLYVPNVGNQYPVKAEDITAKPTMVYMDGQAVYQFAVKAVPDALEKALAKASMVAADIDYFIPHQANYRIIESAAKRFKVPVEKFICNIDRYGNTSAASIPIALDEALENGTIDPKQKHKLAFVGFGAGLTWGACVLEF
jgi:3-oxoacyl-[acyl-carrier-protein] synthase-3